MRHFAAVALAESYLRCFKTRGIDTAWIMNYERLSDEGDCDMGLNFRKAITCDTAELEKAKSLDITYLPTYLLHGAVPS